MKPDVLEVTGQGTDVSPTKVRQTWQAFQVRDADKRVVLSFIVLRDLPTGPFSVSHQVLHVLTADMADQITAVIKDMKSWAAVKQHLRNHFAVDHMVDFVVIVGRRTREIREEKARSS